MAGNNHIFIIYVSDQKRSRDFYSALFDSDPVLDETGMTVFLLPESEIQLGIMPEKGIAEILGSKVADPSSRNGIPGCEIYLFVSDPDKYYTKAVTLKAVPVSEGRSRNWGDYAAYVSDPDGHIIAFAKSVTDEKNN
ncbi:MAG: hypothetical protein JST15_08490 [Bacteroidetes bacterium]|nr:hypothetical protein [Bacteroidota bacterium]